MNNMTIKNMILTVAFVMTAAAIYQPLCQADYKGGGSYSTGSSGTVDTGSTGSGTGVPEQCDMGDLNGMPGSGCTATCQFCAVCGNNQVEAGEECDPPGLPGIDPMGQMGMCDLNCKVIPYVCGNGDLESGETCDDGNTASNDGCSSTCVTEPAVCGNGVKDSGEECDDGTNNSDTRPCTSKCKTARCGDELVQSGVEECDHGDKNGTTGDTCDSSCKNVVAVCGNNQLEAGEECDDGNTDNGDRCSSICKNEVPVPCTLACTPSNAFDPTCTVKDNNGSLVPGSITWTVTPGSGCTQGGSGTGTSTNSLTGGGFSGTTQSLCTINVGASESGGNYCSSITPVQLSIAGCSTYTDCNAECSVTSMQSQSCSQWVNNGTGQCSCATGMCTTTSCAT